MSDSYISIIPEKADFVPETLKQLSAVAYFREITPPGTKIESSVTDAIKLVDCGSNLEKVNCPSCKSDIKIETWLKWMDSDFGDQGFDLKTHKMDCCGKQHTLNELKYTYPMGFARFVLTAYDPQVDYLTSDELVEFARILDCPIRVVYKYL